MDDKIRRFVYQVRARLREQVIIDQLFRMAGIGLMIAVGISLLSLIIPFFYAVLMEAGVIGLSFLVGMAAGIRKTPSPMAAALKADAKGHKERISTAFFLQGKEDAFSLLQKKDALKILENFQIRKEFPLRIKARQVITVLGLALIFTISSMIETPARTTAKTRHAVQKEAKEEIARLEKVEKELKENEAISETELEAVTQQLENARKELKEVDSNEDLKKAEERITKKLEMAGEHSENKTLSEALNKASEEGREAAAERQKELAKQAQEAMEKAEDGSRQDKKEACEKLSELAEKAGDEALAKSAQSYKDSNYSMNDYLNAKNALNNTLANLSESQNAFAQNSANDQTDNGLSRQSSNSSAKNTQNQNGNNQNNNNANVSANATQNNAQNSGSQNQQGEGQNGQDSQSQSGNGQGSGSGNGQGTGSGNGNQGNASGGGWNYGSKEGQEGAAKLNENVTIPDGELGNDENLTGKANGNDSSNMAKSSQAQTWSGNKVSYGEVSGEYKEKAYKKVNGASYPGKLKDKIRNYFDGLN